MGRKTIIRDQEVFNGTGKSTMEQAKRDVLAAATTTAAAEFRRTAFRLRVRRNLQKLKEVEQLRQ